MTKARIEKLATSSNYADRAAADQAQRAPTAHLPYSIAVDGVEFSKTGKTGTNIRSGLDSCEYADADDRRAWMSADGTISEVG